VGDLLHIIGAGRIAVYDEREEEDVGQIDGLADQADGDQDQVGALAPAGSKGKGRYHKRLLREFVFLWPPFYHKR
jgi:hypothetical protein